MRAPGVLSGTGISRACSQITTNKRGRNRVAATSVALVVYSLYFAEVAGVG